MTLDPSVALQIPLRGLFEEDECFDTLKRYLPPNWLETQIKIRITSVADVDDSMDNVQFHDDRIEIVINVIGYQPEDIRCNVTSDKIEIVAQQPSNTTSTADGLVQSNTYMNRTYELPRKININQTICFLSSDGFLGISAPWV
ncbi:hypothetical protein FQR65_LT02629 [Abscondita terminalis]|nr:hypothetical protein FQR65_LT02629 [Abscondita terminalis]